MFLIPGLVALFTFIYLRPQEVFDLMRPVSLAWMVGIVALGYLVDARIGVARLRGSPLLNLLLTLFFLCLITIGVKAPLRITEQLVVLVPSLLAFVFVSQGLQSLRAIAVAFGALTVLTLILAVVGIHQGLSPSACYLVGGTLDAPALETLDGRLCTTAEQCRDGGLPDREYFCEHPGMFDTHSIGKRVRFRGLLEDPNELSWAIAMGLPLAFALYERRRSGARLLMLVAMLALGSVCVVMTKSRSGALSLAAVLGAYFVRRFGWRLGALGALVAALPIIALGGRSGEEADSSSEERLECWSEALSLWRENPLLGVGQGQFTEHHYLTAHNSFLLTLAELGPLGLVAWSASLYFAFKIAIRIQLDFADRPDAVQARIFASALTASLTGMLLSAFFLSIAYHTILWAFLGLLGALHAAVRAHRPEWRVKFGWRDLALVIGIDVAVISTIAGYLRLKGI
jgi:O-Antigen ligase